MVFLISLALVCVFTLLFHKPLAQHPVAFYVIALLMVGIYLYAIFFNAPVWLWRYFLIGLQRCSVALAFFVLVMFASVFEPGSRLYLLLQPLRRQLSILGAIFASGHIVAYSLTFIPRVVDAPSSLSLNLGISLAISLAITVLLVILTATSFTAVHRAMSTDSWKRVQKLAYLFFALIYAHLAFVLGASALAGGMNSLFSLLLYTLLFASYAILRLRKIRKPAPARLQESP